MRAAVMRQAQTRGLRARTIAERRVLVHAVGLVDLDVGEPGGGERVLELGACERAGDAAGPLLHVRARRLVHVGIGDHVGHCEAATRTQDARCLREHLPLVR